MENRKIECPVITLWARNMGKTLRMKQHLDEMLNDYAAINDLSIHVAAAVLAQTLHPLSTFAIKYYAEIATKVKY